MMKLLFRIISGLSFLATLSLLGADMGGMTARFTPEKVKPGDLFVLSVEMHRDDYGQFELEVPSHPQLHLVSKESSPPGLTDGRYHQEERLVLQAVSSGMVTLPGVRARIMEATGTRAIEFPDLILEVLPYEGADTEDSPQPFPEPEAATGNRSAIIIVVLILLVGLVALFFVLFRKQSGEETPVTGSSPKTDSKQNWGTRDFERLLEKHGESLSQSLRADLESYVYAPDRTGIDRSGLQSRLRKELGE